MAFTAPTSPKTGKSAAAAPGTSLLSFMSAASNDIKENMAKQSKRKVNPRNYIKKRVKRLNNSPPAKATKTKASKMAAGKILRGLNSGPSTSVGQRSTSWPLLPQPVESSVYHGQHRGSLPTSELVEGPHSTTLYPAHAQKAIPIDSDLEKVLDVVDELESRSSSPQLDGSDSSTYGQQAFLGEYPFSGSPYSDCSDELFDECYSSSCSPSSGIGYADSPPTATTTSSNDWAPSGPSQPITSNWANSSQTVYTTYAQGIVNPWPVTSSATLPQTTSLPCASYSYDQNLPLTPTASELWSTLAYGENLNF